MHKAALFLCLVLFSCNQEKASKDTTDSRMQAEDTIASAETTLLAVPTCNLSGKIEIDLRNSPQEPGILTLQIRNTSNENVLLPFFFPVYGNLKVYVRERGLMINVTDIFTNNISFTQSVLKNSARNISDDSLQAILSFFKSSVNKHVKSSASTKPLSQQEIKDVDKFAKRAGVSALYLLPHKELFFKIDVKWFEDDVKTYLKAQHNLKVENPEVTFIYKYYLEDLYQAAYPLEATKPGFHGFPARFGQYCLFNEGYISDTVTFQ